MGGKEMKCFECKKEMAKTINNNWRCLFCFPDKDGKARTYLKDVQYEPKKTKNKSRMGK